MVTHDSQVARHGTRIVSMRDGRVVSDQPVMGRLDAREVLAAMPPEVESETTMEGGGQ